MSMIRSVFLPVTLALCLVSAQADAQLIPNPFDTCHVCNQRVTRVPVVSALPPCGCLETTLVPRQQVIYQDVQETRYRQETMMQQVPVTQYRNVTVDEGRYQMVWVPRVVTKQIPETVYEQRTVSRMVPYQTVTRIPQVRTTYEAQSVYHPYVLGTLPTPVIAPHIISVTPTTVTPQVAPRAAENPVQLDSNLTRNANNSYDNQISAQPAGKISASSSAVFRRFQ
jgi:hypothetical protein